MDETIQYQEQVSGVIEQKNAKAVKLQWHLEKLVKVC